MTIAANHETADDLPHFGPMTADDGRGAGTTAGTSTSAAALVDNGGLAVAGAAFFALKTGSAATYACFTAGGQLISSSGAC